jgi:hypothetical protein
MTRTSTKLLVAAALGGALLGLSGCYATHASVGVGYEAPPAAVYYEYDARPGQTYIEGRWVWTAHGWQWYPGYWVAARPGYVYIQGYWDYYGDRWGYRPGTWARHRSGYVYIGGRWRPHRTGHYYDYRRGSWVRRTPHAARRAPATRGGPAVRDYRSAPRPHGSSRGYRGGVRRRDRR